MIEQEISKAVVGQTGDDPAFESHVSKMSEAQSQINVTAIGQDTTQFNMTYLDPFQILQLKVLEKYFVPLANALYEGSWEAPYQEGYHLGGLLETSFGDD